MNEYDPITEEGIKESARLLHKQKPIIPYVRYLCFLSEFIGHDIPKQEFVSLVQNFELQEEINQYLLQDMKSGKIDVAVNEEGDIVFYEPRDAAQPKKKKSRKKKR
jgi:hypothetical protein